MSYYGTFIHKFEYIILNLPSIQFILFLIFQVDLDSNLLIQLVKYLTYFVTKFDKWAYPDILQALKAALTGRGGRLPLEVCLADFINSYSKPT